METFVCPGQGKISIVVFLKKKFCGKIVEATLFEGGKFVDSQEETAKYFVEERPSEETFKSSRGVCFVRFDFKGNFNIGNDHAVKVISPTGEEDVIPFCVPKDL